MAQVCWTRWKWNDFGKLPPRSEGWSSTILHTWDAISTSYRSKSFIYLRHGEFYSTCSTRMVEFGQVNNKLFDGSHLFNCIYNTSIIGTLVQKINDRINVWLQIKKNEGKEELFRAEVSFGMNEWIVFKQFFLSSYEIN